MPQPLSPAVLRARAWKLEHPEKTPRATKADIERLRRYEQALAGRKSVTFGEVLHALGEHGEPADGVDTFRIEKVANRGSVRLTLVNRAGERCDVPIGRLSDRRVLNRNLQLLIGRTDLLDSEQIREALEGLYIKVMLRSYEIHKSTYRGIARAL